MDLAYTAPVDPERFRVRTWLDRRWNIRGFWFGPMGWRVQLDYISNADYGERPLLTFGCRGLWFADRSEAVDYAVSIAQDLQVRGDRAAAAKGGAPGGPLVVIHGDRFLIDERPARPVADLIRRVVHRYARDDVAAGMATVALMDALTVAGYLPSQPPTLFLVDEATTFLAKEPLDPEDLIRRGRIRGIFPVDPRPAAVLPSPVEFWRAYRRAVVDSDASTHDQRVYDGVAGALGEDGEDLLLALKTAIRGGGEHRAVEAARAALREHLIGRGVDPTLAETLESHCALAVDATVS